MLTTELMLVWLSTPSALNWLINMLYIVCLIWVKPRVMQDYGPDYLLARTGNFLEHYYLASNPCWLSPHVSLC